MDIFSSILTFILLGMIAYLTDIISAPPGYYKKCIRKPYFHLKLLFHHIIVIFILLGWLSNNRYILSVYIFIPIILIVHWRTNNNRCTLTEDVNKMCGLDEDEYIRDFLYLIGVKSTKYYDTLYKSFLVFSFFVVLIKLFQGTPFKSYSYSKE
jgi:uncharacterized membrane protein